MYTGSAGPGWTGRGRADRQRGRRTDGQVDRWVEMGCFLEHRYRWVSQKWSMHSKNGNRKCFQITWAHKYEFVLFRTLGAALKFDNPSNPLEMEHVVTSCELQPTSHAVVVRMTEVLAKSFTQWRLQFIIARRDLYRIVSIDSAVLVTGQVEMKIASNLAYN